MGIGLSLRTKFLALFLAGSLCSGAGFGWYFYDHSRRTAEIQLRDRARTTAWTLAFNARYAVLTKDLIVLKDLVETAVSADDVAYAAILDRDGTVLAERAKSPQEEGENDSVLEMEMPIRPSLVPRGAAVDPEVETLFGVAVEAQREARGLVKVGISRSGVERELQSALRSSLALFLVFAGLGGLATLLFYRYLITPILTLSERLARVAAGDLGGRLPEDRSDEIGRLARCFNQMAEGLQASRAAEKEAQEAALQSSRLAAVGEVAGQASHEILNPISAVYGRLEEGRHQMMARQEPLLRVLEEIVRGWAGEYRKGGWSALAASLDRSVPAAATGATIPLVREDLENLEKVVRGLKEIKDRQISDQDFLLREVERVIRIVDAMRSLSRAGANPERMDVHEVLGEAIEVVKDALVRRRVRLEVGRCAEPVCIEADRGEITQILTNLLRNSMQAIGACRGRTGGQISIEVTHRDGKVEIAVRDDGEGIAREDQRKLFETRFTTRGPREGTGLGLGICRRLARAAHGDVRLARSLPGEGTTMIVELPRVEP